MLNLQIKADLVDRLQTIAQRTDCSVEELLTELLNQQQNQATHNDFQDYLKVIHRAGMELAQIESLDDIYRRAVEIGLKELGFERVGLLLVDYETSSIVGTFGTDESGKLRDERDFRGNMAAITRRLTKALRRKERVIIEYDSDLYDYRQVVGQGWKVLAAMWEGDQAVGYFATDNLIHQQPPRPYETELLSLYSATVGHVISRKHYELDLRASEQRFRTLLEAAPRSILLVNRQGRIVSANRSAEVMFGYTAEDFNDLMLDVLLPETLRNVHQQHLTGFFDNPRNRSTEMGLGLELYGLRKDGSQFPIEAALSYFEIEGDILAVAFVVDITERKQADDQRLALAVEKERTSVLAAFIRDAAHEFRTPLSIIHSSLYLQGKVQDADRQGEIRGRIKEQADKILKLVENLSTMARLEYRASDDVQMVNINRVILHVIRNAQTAMQDRKITLWLTLAEDMPPVRGNSEDLALALASLVDNAIRFTPPDGSIVVESILDDDQRVVISIIDTGVGMPLEIRHRIFEQFYRADTAHTTPGLGLGLAIVKKITENHQGSVEVESEPEQGSTFRLILPALGREDS